MAIKSFLVCEVERFQTEEFLVPIQQELLENEGYSEASLRLKYEDFHQSFDQYMCHYDFVHNTSGKVFGQTFTHYFEPLNFYTYINKQKNLSFIQTKTDAAIDFTKKLNGTSIFKIQPIELNFKKIIPSITEVAGAWIADLKRTNLRTAGFFGPNVNRSAEYKEAAAEGNVSSIHIRYISKLSQKEHYIVLSKKGSIILYDSLETIEEEIDLVLEVFNQLIKPHL